MKNEEPKEKYHATVSPHRDVWVIRFYEDGSHIRTQSSEYRWHARWLARKGLKLLRTETEIIR